MLEMSTFQYVHQEPELQQQFRAAVPLPSVLSATCPKGAWDCVILTWCPTGSSLEVTAVLAHMCALRDMVLQLYPLFPVRIPAL